MSMIVNINDFSNGSIDVSNPQDPKWDGTGVFDIIMKAANENIKIQNQTSRITGAEYAEVYLGTMQSAISEAMKFLLNKDQIIKDLELKQTQIESVEADTLIKQEQHTKDLEVKTAQISKINDDLLTSAKQRESIDKDLEVKDIEIEVKTAQIDAIEFDTLIKQEQSDKDLALKQTQIDVGLEEKRLKAAQADAFPIQSAKDILVKQANVDLLNRQKDGFDDNKHQKLFEAQMNAWALMFSSGLLTTKPSIISNDSASSLYNTLKPK